MQNFAINKMEQEVFPDTYIPWKKLEKEAILKEEEYFMQYALHIAQCGRGGVNPNPLVGAIIVKSGKIIAQGYHQKCGEGHAEVNAFEDAKERNIDVKNADMYITLEPCSHHGKTPPCADRIIKEGIKRVIIAMSDPNPQVAGKGIEKLREAGIEVISDILKNKAVKLNEVFLKYITKKEPFIFLKMAMSFDGKIATVSGQSQWISGETSRNQVHYLRNNYMAIMTGIGTVLADNPMLTCRLDNAIRQPIRIIADTNIRIPIDSKIVKTAKEYQTIIAISDKYKDLTKISEKKKEKIEQLKLAGVELLFIPERNAHLNLNILVKELGKKGIDGILLEGGSEFAFAALQAGIVDKIRIYIAPKIIGGNNAKTCIGGEGFAELSKAVAIKDMKAYSCGEDIYLEGKVI